MRAMEEVGIERTIRNGATSQLTTTLKAICFHSAF